MAHKKRSKKAKSTPPTSLPKDELRRRLESIAAGLETIQSALLVCAAAATNEQADLQEELEHFFRRNISDPLFAQRIELDKIVVSLGGTSLTEEDDK